MNGSSENRNDAALQRTENEVLPAELGVVIRQMMEPVLQGMCRMLAQNTAAMEQISAQQQMQSSRLEALEKAVRLGTKVTSQQVKYLNEAMKHRARELLDKKGIEDAKAVTKLTGMIRKDVYTRYGIAAMHEIPQHEYSVAMSQIKTWHDALRLRDVLKEARKRGENGKAIESAAAVAAEETSAGMAVKPGEPGVLPVRTTRVVDLNRIPVIQEGERIYEVE